MKNSYIITIDQSTSATKSLLFDQNASLVARVDIPHTQITTNDNWIEHDVEEIYRNLIKSVEYVVEKSSIDKNKIIAASITNQRETTVAWDKSTGEASYNAIVWQCSRSKDICDNIYKSGAGDLIKKNTGVNLSPFFSASKISWILQNIDKAKKLYNSGKLCASTIDTFLIYRLTKEKQIKTEYANASRTQLFNISTLKWDEEICSIFGIESSILAEVCNSNSLFGHTDFEGFLGKSIPIYGVIADSQSALYAQGCLEKSMVKATYGTGASVMMNTKNDLICSDNLVSSIAWGINGNIDYVLEGNINYAGSIIKWLIENLQLASSIKEVQEISEKIDSTNGLYLVPAFSGLGAPYWDSNVRGVISGITKTSGKNEIVRACQEAIAYQISDIIFLMNEETKRPLSILKVDGGPTKDKFLMQFQSDIIRIAVEVSNIEELSAMGSAYIAGMTIGLYDDKVFLNTDNIKKYLPLMSEKKSKILYNGWKNAVQSILN